MRPTPGTEDLADIYLGCNVTKSFTLWLLLVYNIFLSLTILHQSPPLHNELVDICILIDNKFLILQFIACNWRRQTLTFEQLKNIVMDILCVITVEIHLDILIHCILLMMFYVDIE